MDAYKLPASCAICQEHIILRQHGETCTGAEMRGSTNNKCLLVFYLDIYHDLANAIVAPPADAQLAGGAHCQALPMAHGKVHLTSVHMGE